MCLDNGRQHPVPSTISDVSAFNNYFLTCNSSSLSSSCCSVTVKDMCYVINPSRGMLATRRGSASSPSPWSPWEHGICQLLHRWKSWAVPKRDTLARRSCWRSPDSSRSSPSPLWGATQRSSITGCQLSKATRSMARPIWFWVYQYFLASAHKTNPFSLLLEKKVSRFQLWC